jgi:hypothetical protein
MGGSRPRKAARRGRVQLGAAPEEQAGRDRTGQGEATGFGSWKGQRFETHGIRGREQKAQHVSSFQPLPPWRNICAPRFYVLSCYYIKKFMKKLIKNIIEYFISSSIKF